MFVVVSLVALSCVSSVSSAGGGGLSGFCGLRKLVGEGRGGERESDGETAPAVAGGGRWGSSWAGRVQVGRCEGSPRLLSIWAIFEGRLEAEEWTGRAKGSRSIKRRITGETGRGASWRTRLRALPMMPFAAAAAKVKVNALVFGRQSLHRLYMLRAQPPSFVLYSPPLASATLYPATSI